VVGNQRKKPFWVAFGPGGGGGGGHVERRKKKNLLLAFECEGGGGGKRRIETPKKTVPARSSRLNAREVVVARDVSRRLKKTGSDSHLDAREVVVGGMLEEESKTPPARVRM